MKNFSKIRAAGVEGFSQPRKIDTIKKFWAVKPVCDRIALAAENFEKGDMEFLFIADSGEETIDVSRRYGPSKRDVA